MVLDDGSPDRTAEVVARYSRPCCVWQDNRADWSKTVQMGSVLMRWYPEGPFDLMHGKVSRMLFCLGRPPTP